jgi:hopene-associated glycosyltransferase HpnB
MVTPEQLELTLRVLAIGTLVFWVLLWFDRRRWWPSDWSLHLDAAARQTRPGLGGELVVVVPARNEAATLPRTLPRLMKQAEWFRALVVVDDRSTDLTTSAAQRLARGTAGGDKLQVVRIDEEREGWSGKVNAMDRGLTVATRGLGGDHDKQWVLFTDADVLHPSSSISRLLARAVHGEYDLVSVMVRLRARALWEILLIPPFTYFFQLLYPFKRASDPGSRVAAAAGGCILVRRSLLDEIGGLESIRDRAIDDVALARAVKRAGGRCWLGLDPDMSSIRTYVQLSDVVRMVARTAFEQLGNHYLLVPFVLLALLVLVVGPPIYLTLGAALLDPVVAGAGLAAWLLQSAHLLPVVQYLGAPSGFALTLPLAGLLYGYMTLLSAVRYLFGSDPGWRESTERDVSGV